MRSWAVALVLVPSLAWAEQRPIDLMVPMKLAEKPPALINSHILFMNNCRPNGCVVKKANPGETNSKSDQSDIVGHAGTLTAFPQNVSWAAVMSCVQNIMAPYNITVTDVDPGNVVDHFEVMVGGAASQLGFGQGIGGVADYLCTGAPGECGSGGYIPNALVFDFQQTWGSDTTAICGTAAQEIGHAWTLDHSTLSNSPMTYKSYSTPLAFRDNSPCGSDCGYSCPGGGNNCNSFGVQCSGGGFSATHPCMETGVSTQNESTIVLALFGPAGAKAPTVAITSPANGGAEQTGMAFAITATCSSSDGLQELDLSIDGIQKATLLTSPATFMAPNNLTEGSHHLQVLCGSKLQATATATADIIVGSLCSADTDCPANGICYQKTCIAGPNAPGGLGATCTMNSNCKQNSCASDGSQSLCVVPCDPNNDQCPAGFGCLDVGNGTGVCWLGADKGGGCCDTRGDGRGSWLVGLGIGALWITRRRPKKRG